MAKYIVNHTCGHQVEVQLYGKQEERYRRIAYLETLECNECRRILVTLVVSKAAQKLLFNCKHKVG